MRLSAQPFPRHIDQSLGIDQHGMINRGVAVLGPCSSPVIPVTLDKMLHPDLMPDKVDRYKGGDASHLDPKQLGPDRRVLAAVDLFQGHGRVLARGKGAGEATA